MEDFRAMGWGGSERAYIEATQDLPLQDVPPRPTSVASGTDGEWHMVSPNGSSKAPSLSPRSSVDAAFISDRHSSCSDAARQAEALAEQILGHSVRRTLSSNASSMNSLADAAQRFAEGAEAVLLASASAVSPEAADDDVPQLLPYAPAALERDDLEALRAASWGSQEGSLDGVEGLAPPAAAGQEGLMLQPTAAPVVGEAAARAVSKGLGGFELLATDLVGSVKGAGVAVTAGVLGVQAWLVNGMQLLIKAAQMGSDGVNQAVQSLLGGVPVVTDKAGSLAWSRILTSAALAALAGALVVTYRDNRKLRDMVARRDHELSKLVMRVVSLQELLHQQRQLPITRYHAPITSAAPYL